MVALIGEYIKLFFFVSSQIKVENTSKQVIFKGLAPRVVLTNHLLPKGTKTKVNLEEQGRQKVSFSFTQTKKPRQKVFFVPPSPEKAASEISPAVQSTNLPSADLTGQSAESKNEQIDPSVVATTVAESQAPQPPLPLASKPKHDKVHFKKQILSVSVVEERPTVSAVLNDTTSETEVLIRSSARIEGEPSVAPFQHNSVTDCSEKANREKSTQEKLDTRLKGPTDSSHIGKECKDSISEPEHSKNIRQPDSTLPSSNSDGESVRTSSSQKSSDSKDVVKCDSQSAVAKKSSSSKSEVSDKSRSDKREEKDEKGSSRGKSERDTRHTSSRSSRSDRRRTKSRSRSRSRSSRTSYSRSERSRNERQSRSDRSHYHDSERRSHRSSRERRRSRSRGDGRFRDSSDSEDDLRKPRTRGSDSSRSSTYSSSQRDSKTSSHSKSYRDSKSDSKSSPHSSESDRRTQYSRNERSGRTSCSEPSKRSSPESEASHKKSSSHSKTEVHGKTSNSNNIGTTLEKTVQKTSGSSDSDDEHKVKTQFQGSDTSAVRSSVKKTYNSESKSSSVGTDEQLVAKVHVNTKPPHLGSEKIKSQGEFNKVDVHSQHDESKQSKLTNNSSLQKQEVVLNDSLISHIEFQSVNKDSSVTEKWSAVGEVNISTCHVTLKDISLKDDQLGKQTDVLIQNNVQILKESQTNVANVGTFSQTNDSSSLNEPPYPGYTPSQDSLGSLADTLSVKELPPGECLKSNTKFVSQLLLSNDVSRLPMNVETSPQVAEQSPIQPEQTNAAVLKQKGAHVKKSRWDIVGQDTSENQTPQKTANNETSSVKKVISVKKIEFNNDASHEGKCSKQEGSVMDSLKSELEEQADKATTESEKEIKKDPDQTFAADAQQTSDEGSDPVSDKSLATPVPLTANCSPDALIGIDQKYVNSDKLNSDASYKPLTQESVSFNCDGKSHSEESETDDSDSDSDDGQVSLKRLHSVVVVPKNSTITLETTDQPTPPASPSALSGQLTYRADESSISINSELPNSHNTPIKPVEYSEEGNKHSVLPVAENTCMPSVQIPYQSQSDLVDSTSQSEAIPTLAHTDRNCTVQERPKTCVPTDQVPTYAHREAESGCHLYHNNPDSWHGREGGREQFGDFSCTDNLRPQNSLNQACDFMQTEQPSSTFQQPDSSHSTQLPSQIGSAFTRPDGGYWTQAKVSDKSIPVNTLVPSPCHESMCQIHPDSLTNDHEEDYEGKAFGLTGGVLPSRKPPASFAFVQANEISSNCSFVTATAESQIISEPPRESSQRPHRGRGPPKKRRPELESESDNEAEAGLACKRECLEERERCKDAKETKVSSQQEEEQRPLLSLKEFFDPVVWKEKSKQKKMPPYFDLIEENVYLTERSVYLLVLKTSVYYYLTFANIPSNSKALTSTFVEISLSDFKRPNNLSEF